MATPKEQEQLEQLADALELYCADKNTTPRELFEQLSVVDILDNLRRHNGDKFIVAFAPVYGLDTTLAQKLLMRARKFYLQAEGAMPIKNQIMSHGHWIRCTYSNKELFPEGDHKCGYWMPAEAEFCLNCGHNLDPNKPSWTAMNRLKWLWQATFGLMAVIVGLTVCLFIPSPVSFRWIGLIIGAILFTITLATHLFAHLAWRSLRQAEQARKPRETLCATELALKKRWHKVLASSQRASALLAAGETSEEEAELLKQAIERRKKQMALIDSEIKKIKFLRWQNQVEHALDALHDEDTSEKTIKGWLDKIRDQGAQLLDDWKDDEPFGKEARERITSLNEAGQAARKMLVRREVLKTLKEANTDTGETQAAVLTDVEARGEATEAITTKVALTAPDFLQTEIALEGMRLTALMEIEDAGERGQRMITERQKDGEG